MVVNQYLVKRKGEFVVVSPECVDFDGDEYYLNMKFPIDLRVNNIMKEIIEMETQTYIDTLVQVNIMFIAEVVNLEVEERTKNAFDIFYTKVDYGDITKSMGQFSLLKRPSLQEGIINIVNQSYVTIWANYTMRVIRDNVRCGTHWANIMRETEKVLQHVAVHVMAIVDIKDNQCKFTVLSMKHFGISLLSLRQLVFYEVMASMAVRIYMLSKTERVTRYGNPYEYTTPLLYTKHIKGAHEFTRQVGVTTSMITTLLDLTAQMNASQPLSQILKKLYTE